MLRLTINAVSIAPGGGLVVLLSFLRAWQEIGARIVITVYASREPVLNALRTANLDSTVIPFGVGEPIAGRVLREQLTLGRKINATKADVVLTSPAAVRRCRVPQVVHHQNLKRFLHQSRLRWLRPGTIAETLKDLDARSALRRSSANVFVSGYLREQAERLVPESAARNYVIHNGLSTELIDAARSHYDEWDGEPRLLAVQTAVRHKDNPTLIRTLATLVETDATTPWRLIVAGGGDWSAARRQARKLGISDRVRFLGHVSPAELDRLYSRSACLLFTSVLEAFGNPLIEAMARCCPPVAFAMTAMPEVIGDAGLLVEPGHPEQFAEAVLRIYRDRKTRQLLVERGLERIQHFRWVDSATRLAGLLERCAA